MSRRAGTGTMAPAGLSVALLRVVRDRAAATTPQPRVIGIDDWAWRKQVTAAKNEWECSC
jgi:hypothetical protein